MSELIDSLYASSISSYFVSDFELELIVPSGDAVSSYLPANPCVVLAVHSATSAPQKLPRRFRQSSSQ